MYTPFNQLSDQARIWIYQANRPLRKEEATAMLQKTKIFLAQWSAHGNPLQGSAAIRYDHFLILAVEESTQSATGCAVDASMQLIRGLEQAFQVDFLARTNIAFRHGHDIWIVPIAQLKAKVQQGAILPNMLTFDNTITQKGALVDQWLVRAQDAWLGRYFQ